MSRKHRKNPKKPAHFEGRHGPLNPPPPGSAPPASSAPPPPPGSIAIWILRDGGRVAAIEVDPIADERLARTLFGLTALIGLAADLAPRGAHRLELAEHVARAAAGGGIGMSLHEIDLAVAFFDDMLRQVCTLGGNEAAAAVWHLLVGDRHRDPARRTRARCPSVAAMRPAPGEPGFVEALRTALGGYVRTAIAGASESEIADLRGLMMARVDIVEETGRPWSRVFGAESNGPVTDLLDDALDHLTRRTPTVAQLCSGVGSWASAFAQIADEHTIDPVARLAAIVWLARVALPATERAA